jgi:hypothetical protein
MSSFIFRTGLESKKHEAVAAYKHGNEKEKASQQVTHNCGVHKKLRRLNEARVDCEVFGQIVEQPTHARKAQNFEHRELLDPRWKRFLGVV